MGCVVVVGGGVAGLASSVVFAQHGHQVTVIERDDVSLPPTPEEAFTHWPRRGAPQVHHSHAFLALLRNILRDEHPQLLAALLDAGATELRFTEDLPETITDRAPRPGDDDLVALACRRTTFEWVLRRHALATGGVALRQGAVTGLRGTNREGGRGCHIDGVELGNGGVIEADLVIDASGRRSPLPGWLAGLSGGDVVDEHEEDTGIVYSSRFFRLRHGRETPELARPTAADLGYLKFAVFIGDNRTFSVTYGVPSSDRALRALLREEGFDAASAAIPALAPWVDVDLAEPITGVEVMAGLVNRRRTFVVDGEPVVTGLLAVGDAHTCTNPLYGRGCSLAVLSAHLAGDAVGSHPADPVAAALAYDEAMAARVQPWYVAAVAQDRRSKAAMASDEGAGGRRDDGVADDALGLSPENLESLLQHGLLPATRTDPVVFRAFLRAFNLLDPPDTLMRDPEVMARVLAVWQEREQRPPEPPLGPDKEALLVRLA